MNDNLSDAVNFIDVSTNQCQPAASSFAFGTPASFAIGGIDIRERLIARGISVHTQQYTFRPLFKLNTA